MKTYIAKLLSCFLIVPLFLLGISDILLLPEKSEDDFGKTQYNFESRFLSFTPVAIADGGGPTPNGTGVCTVSGTILTGSVEGNPVPFFCCTTTSQCSDYYSNYSAGGLTGKIECATGEIAALYCPVVATGLALSMSKSVSSASIDLMELVQYTLTASGIGSGSASGVQIIDIFAPGFVFSGIRSIVPGTSSGFTSGNTLVWSFGDVLTGFSGTLVYEGYYTSSGVKTNNASYVVCSGTDCSDFAVTTVLQPVVTVSKDLLVHGVVYTGDLANGMTGTYRITVSNSGSGDAHNMIVVDTLPSLFTYSSSVFSTGSALYDGGGHTVTRNAFTLQAGTSLELLINGSWTVTTGGLITNFVSVNNTGYCSMSGGNCNAQVSSLLAAPVTGQCATGVMISYYSGASTLPPTTGLCITGTLSGLVQGVSGWTWSCAGLNNGTGQNSCNLHIRYCGDGLLGTGNGYSNQEQCDDSNITNGDGCSSICQYETPTCSVGLSPNAGIAPLLVTGSRSLASWVTTVSFDRGDSTIIMTPTSPLSHTYTLTGSFTTVLIVSNNLSGSTLTGFCTGLVTVSSAPLTGSCGTIHNSFQYDFNNSGDVINSGSAGLCAIGGVSGFAYSTLFHTWQRQCLGVNSGAAVSCNATERYCGDGLTGSGVGYTGQEQCDDGNLSNGDGCSSTCQYESPFCTLSLTSSGYLPVTATGTRSIPSWMSATQLDWGNSTVISNPTSPSSMVYGTAGNYLVTLIIQNNLTGATGTGQCTGSLQVLATPVTGLCNVSVMTSYYSGVQSLPSSTGLCTTGNLSGLTQGFTGWSRSCLGISSGGSQTGCSLSVASCGDGIVQGGFGEQCDNQVSCNNSTCQRSNGPGGDTFNPIPDSFTPGDGIFGNNLTSNPNSNPNSSPNSNPNSSTNQNSNPNSSPNSGPNSNPNSSPNSSSWSNSISNNTNGGLNGLSGTVKKRRRMISVPLEPIRSRRALYIYDTLRFQYNNLVGHIDEIIIPPRIEPVDSTPTLPIPSPVIVDNDIVYIPDPISFVLPGPLPTLDLEQYENASALEPLVILNNPTSSAASSMATTAVPVTDINLSYNSVETFSLGLNSLLYLYTCQGEKFVDTTLHECIQQLPYDSYCNVITKKNSRVSIDKPLIKSCIKQVKDYNPGYDAVPGALYLDLQQNAERIQAQLIIYFLSQFITIKSYKPVLEPYEPGVMRLEFDPTQVDNASMYGLLAHLGGESLASHIIAVPLFKIANQKKLLLAQEEIDLSSSIPAIQNISNSQSLFSDPLYPKQTYLNTIGFQEAISSCTWNPSKTVSVAIIDSAFDLSHEDLKKNIVFQKDVANDDDDAGPPFGQVNNKDRAHGTYSAGIIGATTDNEKGLMSVPANSLKVSVYKATSDSASSPSDITYGLEALTQAGRAKPDIINVSRGIFSNNDIPVLKRLITKIINQGTTIIASAGNYNSNQPFYPAAYDKVISVGAVDNSRNKASFSNYGSWVDIAAPGVDIMTTSVDNLYEMVDGTSEAAPVVTAGLAYILGRGGSLEDIFNNLTPILSDLGKGVMDIGKTCKALAATYDPTSNTPTYQPVQDQQTPNVHFATQAESKGLITLPNMLLLLLIILLLGLLIYMRRQIRKTE